MRLGVISDLHADAGALSRAFDVLERRGADRQTALDEALRKLAVLDARVAEVVELRCFGGLEVSEVAALLNLDERTVYRDWAMARAWLRQQLSA